jgi:GLPGLI family protein
MNSNAMHKILLTTVMLLLVGLAYPQQDTGVIRYLVTHDWVKKMESVDYLSKEEKEKINYTWGNDAEWKEYGTLFISGKKTKFEDSEEKAEAEYEGFSWRKEEYYIYRDFGSNRIHDIIKLLGKVYIIEDTLVPQGWKILNDMKEVCGHICMNASWTDTIKNKKVIAWYALDIPLSGGPDRYCGLPGLILEVNVNNGALIMTADRIEYKDPGEAMNFPAKIKGKHIKEADYIAKIKKYIADKKAEEEPWCWGIRY